MSLFRILTEIQKGGAGSGHYGHEGRPGEQGGSLPGEGGGGGSADGKTDWQGRPLEADRTIRGGNLTVEEVRIFDLAEKSPLGRFNAKQVDTEALGNLKDANLVKGMPRLFKSQEPIYQLTAAGHDVQTQLSRIRKRKESNNKGGHSTGLLRVLSEIQYGLDAVFLGGGSGGSLLRRGFELGYGPIRARPVELAAYWANEKRKLASNNRTPKKVTAQETIDLAGGVEGVKAYLRYVEEPVEARGAMMRVQDIRSAMLAEQRKDWDWSELEANPLWTKIWWRGFTDWLDANFDWPEQSVSMPSPFYSITGPND